MMPSAGGVFLGVVKRRNSMITDAASPASYASTEAENDSNLLVSEPLADYAITLDRRPLDSRGCVEPDIEIAAGRSQRARHRTGWTISVSHVAGSGRSPGSVRYVSQGAPAADSPWSRIHLSICW
jgi:hypothetical protein